MGSCFSRGKGRHPPLNYALKHREEIEEETRLGGEGGDSSLASNGNTREPALATSYSKKHHLTNHQHQQLGAVAAPAPSAASAAAATAGMAPGSNQQHQLPLQQRISNSGLAAGPGSDLLHKEMGVAESKMAALFESYCGCGGEGEGGKEGSMSAEGVERLCADLGLSPDSFPVLVLAWQMNAQQMCAFSRDEFLAGCHAMRVDSLAAMRARLHELANQVTQEPVLFKQLYRFTFRFGVAATHAQRSLPTDMAALLWRVVFSPRPPPILERWLAYLERSGVSRVPADTWNMFLHLADTLDADLTAYDSAQAWPSIFDDFVEFEHDHANQNVVLSTDAKNDSAPSFCK